jgi:hypothetical protein
VAAGHLVSEDAPRDDRVVDHGLECPAAPRHGVEAGYDRAEVMLAAPPDKEGSEPLLGQARQDILHDGLVGTLPKVDEASAEPDVLGRRAERERRKDEHEPVVLAHQALRDSSA